MKTYVHLIVRALFKKEGAPNDMPAGSQMDFFCESSSAVLPVKGSSVLLNLHPKKGDWSMTVYKDCEYYFDPETRTLVPIIHLEDVDDDMWLEDKAKWDDDLKKITIPHLSRLGFVASPSGDFDPKKLFKKPSNSSK